MPYVVKLVSDGVHRALESDPGLLAGLNVAAGEVTYAPVARDQGIDYTPPQTHYRARWSRDDATAEPKARALPVAEEQRGAPVRPA